MSSLVPCASCRRHVRAHHDASPSACPFCGAAVSATTQRAEPTNSGGRARRAAMLAVSAALASTAFVACGDDTTNQGGSNAGGESQGGQPGTGGSGGTTTDGGGGNGNGGDGTGGDGTGGDGGEGTGGDEAGGAGEGGTGGMLAPPYGAPPF